MPLQARRLALGVSAAVVVATVLGAQVPQQRQPVFRSGAVLVTVDAYPQREGKIVEGLTAGDFEILEDGKPQKVENFEFVRIEPSLSESERRDPNTQQEANAIAADPHNRVFVAFLDRLHITVAGSHGTRRPLVDALNRVVAPNDLFGVLTVDTDPRHLVLGRRLLTVEEQLTKYWSWGERQSLTFDPVDPMESTLFSCFDMKPTMPPVPWYISDNGQQRKLWELLIDRRREDRTLTALEKMIDHLSGLREARTVALVFTDGWRLFNRDQVIENETKYYGGTLPPIGNAGGRLVMGKDPTGNSVSTNECNSELVRLTNLENEQRLRDLIHRANRANISFYPVTPAGMAVFDTPISARFPPTLEEDGRRLRARLVGLQTLAEATDGLAIINTNDIAAGMRRIVDDVSAFYLLGYYSTNIKNDGRYRRIEVKVKQPGLHLRARRGYFAPAENASKPGGAIAAPALAAAPAGLADALSALGSLRPAAEVFTRGVVDGATVRIAVELAASRAASAPFNAGAEVQVVVTGQGGTALSPVTARIAPGTRAVLLDAPIQGAKAPLQVATRVSAGGETLTDGARVSTDAGALLGAALIYRARPAATSPLSIAADLQFRRSERIHVEWVREGDLDQRLARLLGRNGQPLAIPIAITETERDGRKVLAADLNLAPLSPGDFVMEITAGRAGTTETRLIAFRVVQ